MQIPVSLFIWEAPGPQPSFAGTCQDVRSCSLVISHQNTLLGQSAGGSIWMHCCPVEKPCPQVASSSHIPFDWLILVTLWDTFSSQFVCFFGGTRRKCLTSGFRAEISVRKLLVTITWMFWSNVSLWACCSLNLLLGNRLNFLWILSRYPPTKSRSPAYLDGTIRKSLLRLKTYKSFQQFSYWPPSPLPGHSLDNRMLGTEDFPYILLFMPGLPLMNAHKVCSPDTNCHTQNYVPSKYMYWSLRCPWYFRMCSMWRQGHERGIWGEMRLYR